MPGPLNTIVLTLLEARVTLYPANTAGEPVLDQPVWCGVTAADLTVRERWLNVETRPTGAAYPRQHPLIPQFEISLGRVWAMQLATATLAGFDPTRQRYVLDIVWQEERRRDWQREVYYGVTIVSRERGARDRDSEFLEDQVFAAEYRQTSSELGAEPGFSGGGGGGGGSGGDSAATPPAIPSTLPYTVRYVSSTEYRTIYNYNAATDAFTESSAGVSTGRAVLSTAGSQFSITFAGESWSALKLTTAGELEAMEFIAGVPDAAAVPRVEFYYGSKRVASVARNGRVYAPAFVRVSILPTTAPQFELSGSALFAVLRLNGIYAQSFSAFRPSDVAGLKLWVDVSDLPPHTVVDTISGWLRFEPWPNRAATFDLEIDVGDTYYLPTGSEFLDVPPETDGRPAVYFDKDTDAGLRTVDPIVGTVDIVAFIVVKPGQVDGVSGGGSMTLLGGRVGGSDATVSGCWQLQIYNGVLQGNVWTNGGAVRNEVNGTTLLNDQLVELSRWWLCEQEASAAALTVRVNGVTEATAALSGTFDATNRAVIMGGRYGTGPGLAFGLAGLVRSAVVYEGTLTNEAKAKVRQFLNNRHEIY